MTEDSNNAERAKGGDSLPNLVRRFDPVQYHDQGGQSYGFMEEDQDGDYVRISDYEFLQQALIQARTWGISSRNFSATQSHKLSEWVDDGMVGDPPRVPDHFPKRPPNAERRGCEPTTNSNDYEDSK